jgi:hypothetical protein
MFLIRKIFKNEEHRRYKIITFRQYQYHTEIMLKIFLFGTLIACW